MGEVVNLKRFRKRAERTKTDRSAEENRARFGRTKAERARDRKQHEKLGKMLDQHRMGEDET